MCPLSSPPVSWAHRLSLHTRTHGTHYGQGTEQARDTHTFRFCRRVRIPRSTSAELSRSNSFRARSVSSFCALAAPARGYIHNSWGLQAGSEVARSSPCPTELPYTVTSMYDVVHAVLSCLAVHVCRMRRLLVTWSRLLLFTWSHPFYHRRHPTE